MSTLAAAVARQSTTCHDFAPAHRSLREVTHTRRQRFYLGARRVGDIVSAGAALVVLSPVLAGVSAAILVTMGRPVLFVQERTTLRSQVFRLRKFRTMRQIDRSRGIVEDGDRITGLGEWLRSTSLDELPTLWNVFIGDVTLIGPRPLVPDYLPRYSAEQLERHEVRAGLTGAAQVSGRNNLPWDDRFELDRQYVQQVGPILDLKILARTVAAVFGRDGVSQQGQATVTSFPGPEQTGRLRLEASAVENEWIAITSQNEQVARCALRAEDEETAVVSLQRLGGDPGPESDALLAEALTLLLTRARRRGFIHAVASPQAGEGVGIEVFARHGFVPLQAAPELLLTAGGPADGTAEPAIANLLVAFIGNDD